MLNSEAMTNTLIGKDGSSHVTHDLMHLDQYLTRVLRMKRQRRHMRVNLAPLLSPVSADLLGSANITAFERSRPSYVRRHDVEGSVNVPRIESCIGFAK